MSWTGVGSISLARKRTFWSAQDSGSGIKGKSNSYHEEVACTLLYFYVLAPVSSEASAVQGILSLEGLEGQDHTRDA